MRSGNLLRCLILVLACAVATPCLAQSLPPGGDPRNSGVLNTVVSLTMLAIIGLFLTTAYERGHHPQ